jgi:phosphoglycolate phosphatase
MPNTSPHLLPYLFDLDGTLVDSLPDIAASANFVRRQYNLPEVPLESVMGMVGDGLVTLLKRALEHRAEEVFDEAIKLYRTHYHGQCVRMTTVYPGVRECLAAWSDAGHPLAVVTNKPSLFANKILEHLELSRWLPVVIGGDTLSVRKPDPSPVWTALDQLGVGRERGLMVGDSVGDIQAGRAAGIRTAAALFGYQPEADLRGARADEYWTVFGEGHSQQAS